MHKLILNIMFITDMLISENDWCNCIFVSSSASSKIPLNNAHVRQGQFDGIAIP